MADPSPHQQRPIPLATAKAAMQSLTLKSAAAIAIAAVANRFAIDLPGASAQRACSRRVPPVLMAQDLTAAPPRSFVPA